MGIQKLFCDIRKTLQEVLAQMSDIQREVFYEGTYLDDDSVHDFISICELMIETTMNKDTKKLISDLARFDLTFEELFNFLSMENEKRSVYLVTKRMNSQGKLLRYLLDSAMQEMAA